MDYKFKQTAVLAASLIVLFVLVVVLILNKNTISRRAANKSGVSEASTSVETIAVAVDGSDTFFEGKMIGSDLSAWKSDPLFFDDEYRTKARDVFSVDVSAGDVSGQPDVSSNDISENDERKDSVSGNSPVSDSSSKKEDKKDDDGQKDRNNNDKDTSGGHG